MVLLETIRNTHFMGTAGMVYKVTQVFLNGVDEATDLGRLYTITKKHPYVVWGVLISQNRSSKPEEQRYPSLECIQEIKAFIKETGLKNNFGIHICGSELVNDLFVSAFDVDKTSLQEKYFDYFKYIQINFNASKNLLFVDAIKRLNELSDSYSRDTAPYIVTQFNDNNKELRSHLTYVMPTRKEFNYHRELIDFSGGEGISDPIETLISRYRYCYTKDFGVAGGIGEHNIISTIKDIEAHKPPMDTLPPINVWVDMESKIRNNRGWLDLDTCERVLDLYKGVKGL